MAPQTHAGLRDDLSQLGLRAGHTVMVHASFRKVGWTVGGAVTVVEALLDVLGDGGTLVMPAETPQFSDPADGDDPRVQAGWHETIRAHLPLFDPRTAPSTMGAIAEAFRTYPGTLRSHHPLVSVCARGPAAASLLAEHNLEFAEGAHTPFEQLYLQNAWTLLLGVGFNRCTSLHYAEFLSPHRRTTTSRVRVSKDGTPTWVEHRDMAADRGRLFPAAGASFESTGQVRQGAVGEATGRFFSTQALVDHAKVFLTKSLAPSTDPSR